MLTRVDVGERSLKAYRGIASDDVLDQLKETAHDLRGVRVLHINATPFGGGVSELLRSVVPLLNDLGLIADWKIISADDGFFDTTKLIHNGLQGGKKSLTQAQREAYVKTSEANAKRLTEQYDVIYVHDPQPAGLLAFHGKGDAQWVWRCHIDTARPNPATWKFLRPYLVDYDAAVFTMAEFVPSNFPVKHIDIIPPAIDPLSPKNLPLPDAVVRQVLDWIGIQLNRPLITQVSRFDSWKDPLGVIQAYRLARAEVPNLQLALVGSMALDDPEGWDIYRDLVATSERDPLIHVFTNLTGVGNIEVNAFQRMSDVVVQKSIREGFGLVVSEALWKETPVVAGRAGGIPLQMADGVGGILVDTVEECAAAILALLGDSARASDLAAKGRKRVHDHFLLPRLMLDQVRLICELLQARPIAPRPIKTKSQRDPVCGITLPAGAERVTVTSNGQTHVFCSEDCRNQFLQNPERYRGVEVSRSVRRNGEG